MRCPHCGKLFWSADAYSEDEISGCICPHCEEFISDEELEENEENEELEALQNE